MKTTGRVLSAIGAVLCAATLVLLLLDLVKPDLDLFLKASVKGFLLLTCVVVIAACALRIADTRKRLRRRLARRKSA
jgi:amino acid transporter